MKINLEMNDKIYIKIVKTALAPEEKSGYYAQVTLTSDFAKALVETKLVDNTRVPNNISRNQIVSISSLVGLGIVNNDFDSNSILGNLEVNNYLVQIVGDSNKAKKPCDCECALLGDNNPNNVVARFKNMQDFTIFMI